MTGKGEKTLELQYYRICRVRCLCCNSVLEYENQSQNDNGPGRLLTCKCGKVGLDPSATLYRIIGDEKNWVDLSETWEDNATLEHFKNSEKTDEVIKEMGNYIINKHRAAWIELAKGSEKKEE